MNAAIREASCYACGKTGHLKRNCPGKGEVKLVGTQRDKLTCRYCHKSGHVEDQCYRKKSEKGKAKSS